MYLPFHHILLFTIWLDNYNNHVQALPFFTLTSEKTHVWQQVKHEGVSQIKVVTVFVEL